MKYLLCMFLLLIAEICYGEVLQVKGEGDAYVMLSNYTTFSETNVKLTSAGFVSRDCKEFSEMLCKEIHYGKVKKKPLAILGIVNDEVLYLEKTTRYESWQAILALEQIKQELQLLSLYKPVITKPVKDGFDYTIKIQDKFISVLETVSKEIVINEIIITNKKQWP